MGEMATYFHGQNSDIHTADGLQTLVLMNPSYTQYPAAPTADAPVSASAANSLFFLNPSVSPASALSHAPPPQSTTQQFVSVAIPAAASSTQSRQHRPGGGDDPPALHGAYRDMVPAMHGFLPRAQYDAWSSLEEPAVIGGDASQGHQQGLSLSLSSQQHQGFVRRGFGSDEREAQALLVGSPSSASGVLCGGRAGWVSVLLGSKYLIAARELLEEFASVRLGDLVKSETLRKGSGASSKVAGGESSSAKEDGSGCGVGDGKRGAEHSAAERQEIRAKKAKLVAMLDGVEQRYRQYHHQMQIVISAFEQAVGIGSARTYTALALRTISKQFRCLKDAISGQIKAANMSLGEEAPLGGKIEGSRLKFIDHHIRQQRALQQLGMVQQNAWRPQRGLPERSVSVLRAWLFEHFLHPYPKDSDKHVLAKKTGLTRSQVSNWFINARVRLWKPMVEEMYMEEVKDQEQNGVDDKASKTEQNGDSDASKSSGQPDELVSVDNRRNNSSIDKENNLLINQGMMAIPANSLSPMGADIRSHQLSGFSFIVSSELDGITQGTSPKRPRNTTPVATDMLLSTTDATCQNMEPNKHRGPLTIHGRDSFSLLGAGPTNFIGGFGQYPIAEIGRFGTEQQFATTFHGNGVSLTLGLQNSENPTIPGGTAVSAHQGFIPGQGGIHLGRRADVGEGNEFGTLGNPMAHASPGYQGMNVQNRKSLAGQLLPDFGT